MTELVRAEPERRTNDEPAGGGGGGARLGGGPGAPYGGPSVPHGGPGGPYHGPAAQHDGPSAPYSGPGVVSYAPPGTSSGAPGQSRPHGVFGRFRALIARSRSVERAYRILIGATGAGVTGLGLLLVPLPGPGWLVVFAGLAILGTEFAWAKRLAGGLRRALERFWAWWRSRREARRRG